MSRIAESVVALALLNCAGCAPVPLGFGAIHNVPPGVSALWNAARRGDKQAQLKLGICYEEGRGVAVDIAKAKALYEAASADSGRVGYTYIPPIGSAPAALIPLTLSARGPGLPEARQRLANLLDKRAINSKNVEK